MTRGAPCNIAGGRRLRRAERQAGLRASLTPTRVEGTARRVANIGDDAFDPVVLIDRVRTA